MSQPAYVFDAYGTLFDVHAASRQQAQLLGEQSQAVSELWRRKQLEYTWLRSLMGTHVDFWQITQDALAYALDFYGKSNTRNFEKLCESYLRLPCYPEVPNLLQDLKNSGGRLAILSNGSHQMLGSVVAANGLQEMFESVLSVEEVRIFKPSPNVYALVEQRLGVPAANTTFFSSNAWDVAGASQFGFEVAWINRFQQPRERLPGNPRWVVESLTEWWECSGLNQ